MKYTRNGEHLMTDLEVSRTVTTRGEANVLYYVHDLVLIGKAISEPCEKVLAI
jgi:hypothetical protein